MKVGFVASAFDLLHTGHILMLKEAKEHCDYLICALHVDPSMERSNKNKPIQSLYERITQLEAVKYVDKIIPYETEHELLIILFTNNIDIRFLGSDYEEKRSFTGSTLPIPIHYIQRVHGYSTSELRTRIKETE
jgi:glycerol-3-phosphate cytidylyltransferase